jgi:hypothetical protein
MLEMFKFEFLAWLDLNSKEKIRKKGDPKFRIKNLKKTRNPLSSAFWPIYPSCARLLPLSLRSGSYLSALLPARAFFPSVTWTHPVSTHCLLAQRRPGPACQPHLPLPATATRLTRTPAERVGPRRARTTPTLLSLAHTCSELADDARPPCRPRSEPPYVVPSLLEVRNHTRTHFASISLHCCGFGLVEATARRTAVPPRCPADIVSPCAQALALDAANPPHTHTKTHDSLGALDCPSPRPELHAGAPFDQPGAPPLQSTHL